MRKRFGLLGISLDQYTEHVAPMTYNVAMQDEGNTAVLDIDGFIGRDLLREWITGEKSKNTAENLKNELRSFSVDKIIVNIHSPGGDLSEGLVIKEILQSKSAEVITNLQGFSASAATAILNAGDKRRMAENSSHMLIHRAMYGIMGFFNQNSFRAYTDDLITIDNSLIAMYAANASISEQEIADLMDEGEGYGRWVNAEDALEMGLIDEIYDPGDQEDEDIDRLENKKKAARLAASTNGRTEDILKAFLKANNIEKEETTDAEEARSKEQTASNEIFKQIHEVS